MGKELGGRLMVVLSGCFAAALGAGGCEDNVAGPNPERAIGLSFKPSNVDLTGLNFGLVADVSVSGANNFVNGDTGALAFEPAKVVFKRMTRADGSDLGVFVVNSLRIEPGASFAVDGRMPVAIVALSTISIAGQVSCPPGLGGGGAQPAGSAKGGGPGGGPGGTMSEPVFAGSGGSFCGVGGGGAAQAGGGANLVAAPYGTAELVPLLAGSAGGTGAVGGGGGGGGALQLVAGKSIAVLAGASVNLPGGGGSYGAFAHLNQEAGGGGSGGALLLEAPSVTIAGAVAVNGGGGGQGSGDAGEVGRAGADPARGGHASTGFSPGGDGGAGLRADGSAGTVNMGQAAGGGGGGVGRVRINTTIGGPVMGGVLSPDPGTGCLTFGLLAPL